MLLTVDHDAAQLAMLLTVNHAVLPVDRVADN